MLTNEQKAKAFEQFDAYNSNDPRQEIFNGAAYPKELLYALRMTEKLDQFAPNSPDYVQLAARCQHIGRWEIARESYPNDKKGYLLWRSMEKMHHAKIAEQILEHCQYDTETIEKVKSLVLKRQLGTNPDTQLIEDVICLVFVEFYLDDFAKKHDDDKVVDILRKTMGKMSAKAIGEAVKISVSERIGNLMQQAAVQSPSGD